ncbi:hypothetical protein [Kutzneria albida]|uniref:Uncharacterized protein n=1 Tax=Kutzneria albida DSM 43870 TaxID=1449976 RepID=W5WL73_9PSEU|nr:hypothetical protein [Kutzneria albida]AHI01302.1 hypothetical protein KALB_7944 [Kutzneria albida DSM 43870]
MGVRKAEDLMGGSNVSAGPPLIGRQLCAEGVHLLRSRWRSASLASGWPFPSDWALDEVDAVCVAAVSGEDLAGVVAGLGRARARAGAGLDETLLDLAALHAVLTSPAPHDGLFSADPDATPSRLIRATAIGWADVASDLVGASEVLDAMTGMTTAAYLRTRLTEVYRAEAAARHVLLVAALDLSQAEGWTRPVAMVLMGDVLREVFPGGETVSLIGPSTAAVLLARDELLITRMARVRWQLAQRLSVDRELHGVGTAEVWPEALPDNHSRACELLAHLAG